MKITDLLDLLEDEASLRKSTLEAKASDYASHEDVLSNFKRVGKLEDRTQDKVILSLVNTKIVRLNNLLLKESTPINEPIEDTILDLQNYLLLLRASLEELKEELDLLERVKSATVDSVSQPDFYSANIDVTHSDADDVEFANIEFPFHH